MTLIASRTLCALEPFNLCSAPSSITSGDVQVTGEPHFLWVTEFPLFTHDDSDKDFLAHGRWSSSHHPFTAPMWQDIDALYAGDIENVRPTSAQYWEPPTPHSFTLSLPRQPNSQGQSLNHLSFPGSWPALRPRTEWR